MNIPQSYDLVAIQEHYNFRGVSVVEKDLEILKVLRLFSEIKVDGIRFVFAGGTCLARAHRLIMRMSEDLDIKIVLSPELAASSASKQRRALSALKEQLLTAFGAIGLQLDVNDDKALNAKNGNRYVEYKLTYDRQTNDASVLDPRIKLETVVSELRLDPVMMPVSSLAAEAYEHAAEVQRIPCVAVDETAAEKFVSLTRRIAAKLEGDEERFDNRIIRHVYDLHMIRDSIDIAAVVSLAREIIDQDAKQFASQHPTYAADPEEATKQALSALENDPSHKAEYAHFVDEMVYGHQVDFHEAMGTVSEIAAVVWGWTPPQP